MRKHALALTASLAFIATALVAPSASAAYDPNELVLSFEVTESGNDAICIPLGTYQSTRGVQGNMDLQIDWGTGTYETHSFDGKDLTLPSGIDTLTSDGDAI